MARLWRSRASFRLGADLFTKPEGALPDPEVVTARLGLEPSHSHRPGERNSPRAAPFRHGQWSLHSPLPRDVELTVHLVWLLERLAPVREAILEVLSTDQRLRADFFCGLYVKEWNEGVTLTPDVLAAMGALKAELALDIYWEGDVSQHSDSPAPEPEADFKR